MREIRTEARSIEMASTSIVPSTATGSTPWLSALKELGQDPGLMSSGSSMPPVPTWTFNRNRPSVSSPDDGVPAVSMSAVK